MKFLNQKVTYFVSIVCSMLGIQNCTCQEPLSASNSYDEDSLINSIPWPSVENLQKEQKQSQRSSITYLNIPNFYGTPLALVASSPNISKFRNKKHSTVMNSRRFSLDLTRERNNLLDGLYHPESIESTTKRRRSSFNEVHIPHEISSSLLCAGLPLSPTSTINLQNMGCYSQSYLESDIRDHVTFSNYSVEETQSEDDKSFIRSQNTSINEEGIKNISSFPVLPTLEMFKESYSEEDNEYDHKGQDITSSLSILPTLKSLRPNPPTAQTARVSISKSSASSSRIKLNKNSGYGRRKTGHEEVFRSSPQFSGMQNYKIQGHKNQRAYSTHSYTSDESSETSNLQLVLSDKLPMYQYVPPKRPIKIILSIDGGGSRGIIPLFYLLAMYRHLKLDYKDSLPIDMFVGTSVGSIVATAAVIGKLKDLHDQYINLVQKIFPSQYWLVALFRMLYYGYKYPSEGRAESVSSFITPEIENLVEQEGKTASLIIPFCSARTHEIFLYKNYGGTPFRLFDAIMASTAAPTYFPPHMLESVSKNQPAIDDRCESGNGIDRDSNYIGKIEGTDGGVVANNPALLAFLGGVKKFPGAKLYIISLGTGINSPEGEATSKRGLLSWAAKSPTLFLDLQRALANRIVSEFVDLNQDKYEYTRINTVLDKQHSITDGVDPDFLRHLEALARVSISSDGSAYASFQKATQFIAEKLEEK